MVRILLSTKLGEIRMKQSELSRLTGIRPNTINLLYHELARAIKFTDLEKICKALKCDVGDLVVLDPSPRRQEPSKK